ncbi:MAG TPA: polysaccharide lyase family protein, partial [Catenuloplanes sp.]
DLEGDNHVFMSSNGRVGLSLIQASKEAFNGGPTKQELTVHDYYQGEILLWHPFTSHYGSPALVPEKGWEKVYGPFLLYANESAAGEDPVANVRDMWAMAKRQARRERARWPYSWVSDPAYAAATRSTVSGRLRIKGGQSAENAWVLLSAPGEDWQYESRDYVYSARADAKGRFTVEDVRPGVYTLTAFVDGALGEYKRQGVRVGARKEHDLSTLHFYPATHGRTLWQIGTPDRSSGEFHTFGGPNGFREHLTWLEYPYEFPDDVDFTIGVDDIATDWNYFQPAYRTPGTDLQLAWRGTVPDRSLTTWRIRFHSDGYDRGVATLDIAIASSVFGTLRIGLNGTDLASFDPLPGPPGDNASYRLSNRGMYRQLPPVVFAATAIRPGENVITLSPTRPPKAPTADNWMEPMAGIMYDVIRLQVDD